MIIFPKPPRYILNSFSPYRGIDALRWISRIIWIEIIMAIEYQIVLGIYNGQHSDRVRGTVEIPEPRIATGPPIAYKIYKFQKVSVIID